ncbi:hypothetical protein MRX96_046769 [Rhipicephalus microplus]
MPPRSAAVHVMQPGLSIAGCLGRAAGTPRRDEPPRGGAFHGATQLLADRSNPPSLFECPNQSGMRERTHLHRRLSLTEAVRLTVTTDCEAESVLLNVLRTRYPMEKENKQDRGSRQPWAWLNPRRWKRCEQRERSAPRTTLDTISHGTGRSSYPAAAAPRVRAVPFQVSPPLSLVRSAACLRASVAPDHARSRYIIGLPLEAHRTAPFREREHRAPGASNETSSVDVTGVCTSQICNVQKPCVGRIEREATESPDS